MLEPRKLATLVAVARTGSIANAALLLDVTASAASQHISTMERELGVALLDRGAHRVRLTPAGEDLVAQAAPILEALAEAERSVVDRGHFGSTRIRLGAFASVTAALVTPLLATFGRDHPSTRVFLREVEPEHAVPQVLDGRLDAAIVHRYSFAPDYALRGLTRVALFSEPILVALPREHRLAEDQPLRWSDLAREDWIASTPAEGFQAAVEYAGRRAGFTPLITHRCDTHSMTVALVRAGCGLALVPRSAVGDTDGVTYRDVDTSIRRHVDFIRQRSVTDPAVSSLARAATRFVERGSLGDTRMPSAGSV